MRRTLAILLVYVVAIVAIVEIVSLTLTPLVNEMSGSSQDLPGLADPAAGQLDRLSEIYARLQLPDAVREWIDSMIAGLGQGGAGQPVIDVSIFLPVLTGAGSLIGAVFGYILLPVWVFYILKDRVALTAQFDRGLPPAWRFDVWASCGSRGACSASGSAAQLVLGFTVGVFTFIGLMVLSRFVDPVFGRYAVLLSVTAGILELLPIIGPIISAVPAVLLAATVGLEPVIAALVLYTLVQQVENNLLVPKIQGDAVEMHPAVVMFAIIIGGALAGPARGDPGAARHGRGTRRRALPVPPARVRRRPEALASSIAGLGLEVASGRPGSASTQRSTARKRTTAASARPMASSRPMQAPAESPRGA